MDWTVFRPLQNPVYQALLFLSLTPLVILISRTKSADKAWTLAVYCFILFMIVNAILLWFADSPWRYFFYSIGSAVAYIVLSTILMKGLIKILRLKDSEESAMAFLVVIYQPIALLVVMVVKWMVTTWF